MDNIKTTINNLVKIELARRPGGFWYFCQLMIPELYNDEHLYLKELCDKLESFIYNDKKVMTISMPPRYGKSTTIQLYVDYLLQDPSFRVLIGSYNEDFASEMCKIIRNRIQEEKEDPNVIVYSDIYNSKVQRGAAQARKFKMEGSSLINVLSTSPNGSSIGMGFEIEVLDDIIKNAADSKNEKLKDKIWHDWIGGTLLSRLEKGKNGRKGFKRIFIGTIWSKTDPIERLIEMTSPDEIEVIKLKAIDEDGNLLCPAILDHERLEDLKRQMPEEIFSANYLQIPLDLSGRLLNNFNTYKYSELYKTEEEAFNEATGHYNYTYKLDNNNNKIFKIPFEKVVAYVDTADTGADYTCCIIAGIYKQRIFILDVYYSQNPMEFSEPIIAAKLKEWNVHNCRVEANNGGRGFARNVVKESKDLNNETTIIQTFTQTMNKQTRIFTNRKNVENYFYWPEDWDIKWPQFFKDTVEYKAEGQNLHDDNLDAITGVYETFYKFGFYPTI